MVIPFERMTGMSSIVSKDKVGDDECLNMVTEMKANGVSLTNFPSGFSPDSGKLQMVFRACVPTNVASLSRKGAAELSTQGSPGTSAGGLTLETILNQKTNLFRCHPDHETAATHPIPKQRGNIQP